MMIQRMVCSAVIAVLLSGCATRPREFDAVVKPAPADTTAFLRDFATCRLFVNSNFRSNSGQKAATLATGVLTSALGGLGAPFVAAGIRSSREKDWKSQMAACLDKYGHKVCEWQPLKKSEATAPTSATRRSKPSPCATPTGEPA